MASKSEMVVEDELKCLVKIPPGKLREIIKKGFIKGQENPLQVPRIIIQSLVEQTETLKREKRISTLDDLLDWNDTNQFIEHAGRLLRSLESEGAVLSQPIDKNYIYIQFSDRAFTISKEGYFRYKLQVGKEEKEIGNQFILRPALFEIFHILFNYTKRIATIDLPKPIVNIQYDNEFEKKLPQFYEDLKPIFFHYSTTSDIDGAERGAAVYIERFKKTDQKKISTYQSPILKRLLYKSPDSLAISLGLKNMVAVYQTKDSCYTIAFLSVLNPKVFLRHSPVQGHCLDLMQELGVQLSSNIREDLSKIGEHTLLAKKPEWFDKLMEHYTKAVKKIYSVDI